MVFGVNVADRWSHSPGQLDVWIRTDSLAETTGLDEAEIRDSLGRFRPFDDCWIALRNISDAEKLVSLLKAWAARGNAKSAQASAD
jgi:hypothetical protein